MAVLLPRLSSLACGKFANRRRILDDMAKYGIAHHIERSITPDWPAHILLQLAGITLDLAVRWQHQHMRCTVDGEGKGESAINTQANDHEQNRP